MTWKKMLSISTACIILLSTSIVFYPSIAANQPGTAYGYVYVNDVIMKPDQVILSFPSQNTEAHLLDDGFYIVNFSENVGETGIFLVTVCVKTFIANETITIQYGVYEYIIDLHVTIPPNNPPKKPENPYPKNNSEITDINPTLNVNVTDPDGDTMNVSFYNASDDSLIDTATNVENGSTASITWSDLSYNTTYQWYAIANDTQLENKSDTWSFTIKENNPPDKPFDPIPNNNSKNVDINPFLSVNVTDPDGDTMNVSFYDASDDSLIGTNYNVNSGGTATVQWTGLSVNTSYTWYAKANDSELKTKSDIWAFTTIEKVNNPPDKPSHPSPGNNAKDIDLNPTLNVNVTDPDGDTMDVSFYDASDDTLIDIATNVENGSTASITWSDLSYNTTYYWYAVANDSEFETKSDTWSFTTKEKEDNRPPCVKIIKPEKALYISNKKVRRYLFRIPLIIGKITIEANAADEDSGIEKVEFYINGKFKGNDTTWPYTYNWMRDRLRIFHLFVIKVIAYDTEGEKSVDWRIVRKFL